MRTIDEVLVTGGAGFIGSFTVDLLIKEGYQTTVLDNLETQVHQGKIPEYLDKNAKFVRGDIRDKSLLANLMEDVDAVIHLASIVGVAQSMYQIEKYVDVNTHGTSNLLDVLVNEKNDVKKLVTASSASIYGEGKYFCEECGEVRNPTPRTEEQLKKKMWEPLCPLCKKPLKPLPTDEDKPKMPASIYAMTKRHQDEMCLLTGKTYGIPTVSLRYFNAYGPRQSLENPYTGVCAIFLNRILNNKLPYIFEDGNQSRDFIHVRDVARANVLALEKSSADYQTVNIGTGKPTSIGKVAKLLIEAYGRKLKPYVSERYRKGDTRHCYADITKAHNLLGYEPSINLMEGLKELAEWAETHKWGAVDLFEKALEELKERELASES